MKSSLKTVVGALFIATLWVLCPPRANAQVINVPQWKSLVGERGWPVYYIENAASGQIGILNTWGTVREVDMMRFTDQEFQEMAKWGLVKKDVFLERLMSGALAQQASETRDRLAAAKHAARADVANHPDEVRTVDYVSRDQIDINFDDGSRGSISPGGLQLQGTTTISHFKERAAALARAGGFKQAEYDQTAFIKALTIYRNSQMLKMKANRSSPPAR